jgi:hypothetical protein
LLAIIGGTGGVLAASMNRGACTEDLAGPGHLAPAGARDGLTWLACDADADADVDVDVDVDADADEPAQI